MSALHTAPSVQDADSGARSIWQVVPPLAVTGLSVLTLALTIATQNRGFSLVDESYQWNLISMPEASLNAGDMYVFPFVLHRMYQLVDGDIMAYRLLGLALIVALATLLAIEVLRFAEGHTPQAATAGHRRRLRRLWRAAVITALAAASTLAVTYNNRLLSYNSLALCGLVLAAAGALLMSRGAVARGTLTVAVGFGLTFTAKPTSALGLAVLSVLILSLLRTPPARWIPLVGVAALTSCAFVLLGTGLTPTQLTTYLSRGAERARLLGGHDSVAAMAGLTSQDVSALLLFGSTLGFAAVLSFLAAHRHQRPGAMMSSAFAALGAVWVIATMVVFVQALAQSDAGHRMRSMALLIPALGAALLFSRPLSGRPRWAAHSHRCTMLVAGALCAGPYVYALGSNTPFSLAMGNAAVLWLAAAVIVAAQVVSEQALPILITASACVVLVLASTSLVDGGSSTSLMAATQPTTLDRSRLLMTPADHAVLSQLENVRRDYGLSSDVPIVDVTGIGPGYAMQLGGRPLGGGFFMGIFDGATEAAEYGLSFESCKDRARAWVLFARNNPADVSRAFTQDVVDLSRDYDVITSFSPTQGPEQWRSLRIQVLRPRSSVAAAFGCERP